MGEAAAGSGRNSAVECDGGAVDKAVLEAAATVCEGTSVEFFQAMARLVALTEPKPVTRS